ncbi:unnamed protein product [Mycena citricolor]|uniref:Histone H1 n=1 Tax=Mycena citricolor TaxID=2018698 RepID=A0AAD2HQR8_9AGAR|nr:unnamed protein product [Mycena citricolor]CAK5279613.1 unnamed protein product [Mycena citricolor]
MPTSNIKTKAKVATKGSIVPKNKSVSTHPPWIDMIKECIIAHPEEARGGVSRPMIKKFVESKYKVEVNAAAASQLNRAITSGSERGQFVLPKGPSGKVKLTPKVRGEAAKENSKPVSKAVKPPPPAKHVTSKAPATYMVKAKPKQGTTTTTANKSAATSKPSAKKSVPAKKTLKPKATVTKKTAAPSKRAPAKKAVVGKKSVTVKKPIMKKPAAVKKAAPSTKKPATEKSKTTKAAPVKTKGKRSIKAEPAKAVKSTKKVAA